MELKGEAPFTPLEGGRFLHYEFGPSHWIIGRDELSPEYTVLYSEGREVSRVYMMTLTRSGWKADRFLPLLKFSGKASR